MNVSKTSTVQNDLIFNRSRVFILITYQKQAIEISQRPSRNQWFKKLDEK